MTKYNADEVDEDFQLQKVDQWVYMCPGYTLGDYVAQPHLSDFPLEVAADDVRRCRTCIMNQLNLYTGPHLASQMLADHRARAAGQS